MHIIGTAMRKENSAAPFRSKPKSIPPTIVAADRDVPGHKASTWNKPTPRDCAGLMDSMELERLRAAYLSAIRITTPPTNNAAVTAPGVKRRSLITWRARKPTTKAGRVAKPRRRTPDQPFKVLGGRADTSAVGSKARNRRQYSNATAKIAPSCMATSKLAAFSPTKPSK